MPEGIGFALAGWLQIGLAAAVLTRPSRLVIRIACISSIAFIAVWVVSRVWGPPVGPESGVAHDGVVRRRHVRRCWRSLLVVAGYELLARPDWWARLRTRTRMALAIVPIGILAVTTAAIASPSAVGHGHAGGEAAAGHGPRWWRAPAAGGEAHGHTVADEPGGLRSTTRACRWS